MVGMKEQNHRIEENENLTSEQKKFINSALKGMFGEISRLSKKSERYEDLKQNIYQLEHLEEYNYNFLEKDGKVLGIQIISPKEN